jgi:hypothetical protein
MTALYLVGEINLQFDSYQEVIVDDGRQPALFMLIAFGATFGITRFITHSIRSQRFSWLKDVESGDTHIHHLVWGICLLLISGVLAVGIQPALEVTAVVFGIGAALTLDEFALWLHLDDVYWSEQGRQSIDAVIVFALMAGLTVVGLSPIVIGTSGGIGDFLAYILFQIPGWILVVICFLKGKLIWGVLGLYFWPVGLIGAIRLAHSGSWWAKHRYADKPEKLERANRRYRHEADVHLPAPAEPSAGA